MNTMESVRVGFLGLKKNERFKIDTDPTNADYFMNEEGLFVVIPDGFAEEGTIHPANQELVDLLREKSKIVKFPYKSGRYFYPSYENSQFYRARIWNDTKEDRIIQRIVGVYNTKAEAVWEALKRNWTTVKELRDRGEVLPIAEGDCVEVTHSRYKSDEEWELDLYGLKGRVRELSLNENKANVDLNLEGGRNALVWVKFKNLTIDRTGKDTLHSKIDVNIAGSNGINLWDSVTLNPLDKNNKDTQLHGQVLGFTTKGKAIVKLFKTGESVMVETEHLTVTGRSDCVEAK